MKLFRLMNGVMLSDEGAYPYPTEWVTRADYERELSSEQNRATKAEKLWFEHSSEREKLQRLVMSLEGSAATLENECNQLNDMTIKQRALIDELASMCRRLSYSVKRAGNDTLAHQCVELLKKHDLGGSVLRTDAKLPQYKFGNVTCSQCGGEFGPGNHGFSHCENHKHLPRLG